MTHPYLERDAQLVDYEPYRLEGVDRIFRGPPIIGEDYLACLGAAQTFGRFVQTPFPRLIAKALDREVLNLGQGGVGPTYFTTNPALMAYTNRARLVVVQVLSARSVSNSLYEPVQHGARGRHVPTGREMKAGEFYSWLLSQGVEEARRIIAETRANYVAAMTRLLREIGPPKILFWFSVRPPDYVEILDGPQWRAFGAFPQFVNRAMVEQLASQADAYVECVSNRGLPQKIVDRDGLPSYFMEPVGFSTNMVRKTENTYYPSPEMHEDAAARLVPVCRELLVQAGCA